MIYTDTRDSSVKVDFKTAVMGGMNAQTGGLYMPVEFPELNKSFLDKIPEPSFRDIAFESAKPFVEGEIPDADLQAIIADAYPFNAQVVPIDPVSYVLELFHGPTCAFKDFGARFMGKMMGILNENEQVIVLTATSGDTGSAVANGFYGVKGVKVVVLYPADKISSLQEAQMTTLYNNVYPLKVSGTFDDCQRMVKSMFSDEDLRKDVNITSANSINILRWIPQAFYYFYGWCAWQELTESVQPEIVVPSGNYGNLTAGMLAHRMGLPVKGFVAASNANDVIPEFLNTAEYRPRPSVQTLANAMDVGAPSNYERMMSLCNNSIDDLRAEVQGFSASDKEILETIKDIEQNYGYLSCPHSAVGYAATKYLKCDGFWLSTAHAAKFGQVTECAIGEKPQLPDSMEQLLCKKRIFTEIPASNEVLKNYLLQV